MTVRSLPAGPWEKLLPRALTLIDEISRYGGIKDPFWTLGGGTVLMFRHHHRLSKDIDIFVPDPQYLGFVTPRLSDTAGYDRGLHGTAGHVRQAPVRRG